MRDLHLTQMLFATDKAINRMRTRSRRRLYAYLRTGGGQREDRGITSRLQAFTNALGGSTRYAAYGSDTVEKEIPGPKEERLRLQTEDRRMRRHSRLLQISLDSAYFEFKIKSPLRDIGKLGEAIETMKGIVREFHGIASDLATLARVSFVEPTGLAAYLGSAPEEKRALPEKSHEIPLSFSLPDSSFSNRQALTLPASIKGSTDTPSATWPWTTRAHSPS